MPSKHLQCFEPLKIDYNTMIILGYMSCLSNILTVNTAVIIIINNQTTLSKHSIAPQPCSNNLMPETMIAQFLTWESQSKAHLVKTNVILMTAMPLCISQVRRLSSSYLHNGIIKMLPVLSPFVMIHTIHACTHDDYL